MKAKFGGFVVMAYNLAGIAFAVDEFDSKEQAEKHIKKCTKQTEYYGDLHLEVLEVPR